ncbi:ABC transporter permease [Halopelagius longus]|uniref:ABC transporter permease n=1 Tax=Halopelagius longus TaxID=1236180 RepID=A0A1H1BSA0_9EURY|nr:ABC transporter permease [Halopelagius longus]RDI70903.1 ABC transporter permease [Halopelagius longus]SDQ54811.1 peptide/nickel transport system permease protein [Halopelagius longus]
MSRLDFVVRRAAFAAVTAVVVLTAVFLLVAVPENPNVSLVKFYAAMAGEDPEAAAAAYRASHNLDKSLWWRYTHWMRNVVTLRFGRSQSMGAPVSDIIVRRAPYTLGYVVPAVALSVVGGVTAGVASALRRGDVSDRAGAVVAYLGYGVPNFYLASVLLLLVGTAFGWDGTGFDTEAGVLTAKNARRYVLPTAVLATTLAASQLRYARSLSADVLGEEFVRLVRAKGAPPGRVARHVVRNAAVPLVTLTFADLLGVLVLNVYVLEFVFDIPGLGAVSLAAVRDRDVPLVLGTTTLVILVGVVGNLLQDVAYAALDPRVDE